MRHRTEIVRILPGVKTCEYCGSEVPDSASICPNCAAHFPEPPGWGPAGNGLKWPAPSPRPSGFQTTQLDNVSG